ncbi:MAG: S1 family peptidase, partial [Gemmatimonadota bacterium]|nr:S1 family peptidase [Gemmatimonadota bacterium]
DRIGTLSQFVSINFAGGNNVVDAAIAEVDDASDVTGTAPSYGAPRTNAITASVGMRVMKHGRTTGFTKGRVQGIGATVNVNYGSAGVARFVGQVIIGGGGFSQGGDSGSLIVVEKGANARRPVGLLFAGGGGTTVANPIADVLSALNVSIVGN